MIKISKPLKKVKKLHKNQFKFKIELMGGDADAWFYPKIYVDKDDPYLERFLDFLKNCKKEYPHGKGGYDNYSGVKDYWLFCGEEYPEEVEIDGKLVEVTPEIKDILDQEIKKCNIGFEWESNYEYFGESSFNNVTITYFDENSIEYKCEFNLNE